MSGTKRDQICSKLVASRKRRECLCTVGTLTIVWMYDVELAACWLCDGCTEANGGWSRYLDMIRSTTVVLWMRMRAAARLNGDFISR